MRIMRRDACALLRIMPYAVMRIISVRTFAYYAHMRICFVDAHNMHICSYYAHIIRICAYHAYMRISFEKRGGGPGGLSDGHQPLP